MIQEGLAAVRDNRPGYKTDQTDGESQYRAPASYDNGSFALQVAALKNRSNAYRYADELKGKYGTADVQEATVGGNMLSGPAGALLLFAGGTVGPESFERKGFPGNFVVAVD